MFFIKAEPQVLGFFVAGKPCAGGMVEENLRLFSISLFAFPFLLFPALFLFPTLLSLFFSFFFPFLFPFFLSFFFLLFPPFPLCSPSFFVSLSLSLSLSFLSVLLFPALSAFPALLSLFFSFLFPFLFLFLFPFFLSFFFPLFPPFPLCSFSFLSFCPSFFRSFPLSRFAFPLYLLSALLFSALFLFPTLLSLFFSFLFPFFLSFFFPSFPSFPLCSLRIKFLCYCKKYGPAAVLMNTQYGTRKYHRPEISQKGVLGRK